MSNIPKLRFKEFRGEFYNEVLDNLIKVTSKKFDSSKTKEIKKCVELEHLSQETGILLGYTNSNEQISIKNSFENGQVLFGKLRPYLKKYWQASFDGVCSSEIWVLNGKKLINAYVRYLVQTNKFSQMANISSGSKMPRADWQYMSQIPFNYPTKPEQQKIASFLTSVDKKIELLTQKEKLLKDYKKGIMQKIFSQEIRFKADDGSDFPEWVENRLEDYLTHKSDRNKNFGDSLVLSVSNKKGFITQYEQFDGYEVASKDLSNYKIVNKNNYAYNPSRINVGSIARLKNIDQGIVSPMYVVFKIKETLNNLFFDNLIQTHLFKHLVIVNCSGSVRDSLSFDDMCSFKFKLSCLEEQTKIANFLSAIDSKIEQVAKQLKHTKEFKKGLLQQMFV